MSSKHKPVCVKLITNPNAVVESVKKITSSPGAQLNKARLFQVSIGILLVAFGILTLLIVTVPAFSIDLSITHGLQSITNPVFAGLMIFISWVGFLPQTVILCADYSFPSGHVMFYTGFFRFICFLTYTLLKPSWIRTLLLVAFGSHVVFVGISRIYLGDHWASDVFGGYLLGGACLIASIYFYQWGKSRFFPE